MGQAIGEILPLALGVAISPIPIIATVLMLFAPHAGGTSTGFLIGWVAGIAVVASVFVVLSSTTGLSGSSGASNGTAWLKVGLGAILVLLAGRQWRGRPGPGDPQTLPGWMSALDSFTFVRAAGLGVALAAINPKNLVLCAAAGTAIGGASLSAAEAALVVVVFVLLAASTVAVPVVGYAVAADRMRAPLDDLKGWLEANNATVMSVLLLVMGVLVVGKGLGGF